MITYKMMLFLSRQIYTAVLSPQSLGDSEIIFIVCLMIYWFDLSRNNTRALDIVPGTTYHQVTLPPASRPPKQTQQLYF